MRTAMTLVAVLSCVLGCNEEPASPCETRALAMCDYYARCYPGYDYNSCIDGNIRLCEAEGSPDDTTADQCQAGMEVSECGAEWPQACKLQ